jgi:hypothetical protein
MNEPRDSGQPYALGLAAVAFFVTAALAAINDPSPRGRDLSTALAGLSGGFGMYLGGRAAYALTRGSGSFVERLAIMSPIVVGVAVSVAIVVTLMAIFIVSPSLGLLFVLADSPVRWLRDATLTLTALATVVVWSSLYLALQRSAADYQARAPLLASHRVRFGITILCGTPGVVMIVIALWKLPSVIFAH